MHSTVTKLELCRLLDIKQLLKNKNITKMRTLNNNQITGALQNSNSNTWNSKRRFR